MQYVILVPLIVLFIVQIWHLILARRHYQASTDPTSANEEEATIMKALRTLAEQIEGMKSKGRSLTRLAEQVDDISKKLVRGDETIRGMALTRDEVMQAVARVRDEIAGLRRQLAEPSRPPATTILARPETNAGPLRPLENDLQQIANEYEQAAASQWDSFTERYRPIFVRLSPNAERGEVFEACDQHSANFWIIGAPASVLGLFLSREYRATLNTNFSVSGERVLKSAVGEFFEIDGIGTSRFALSKPATVVKASSGRYSHAGTGRILVT